MTPFLQKILLCIYYISKKTEATIFKTKQAIREDKAFFKHSMTLYYILVLQKYNYVTFTQF